MKSNAAKLKRPLWRRVLRAAGILVASVVTLAVLAVAFLHTRWGKEVVRGRIEAKLGARVNGSVHIGSLDYTFLLGTIHVGDVRISDATGRPAISVWAIDVALDRSSLVAKDPLIERLAIHGLDVSLVKTADGRSNLTGLFKPSRGKASLAHLRVAELSVDGKATITKPDGTRVTVTDLALAGNLEARPVAQELDAALSQIVAHIAIAKPGTAVKQLDVGIASVSLARRATGVDAKVASIAAGPLTVESIAAHAGLASGVLAGEQLVTLQGARVERTKLAALLGHDLLADDLAVDMTIKGPPEKLALAGSVRAGTACLDLHGTADVAASRPSYQLAVIGDDLRPGVIVTRKKLPDVASDLRIDLRGSGKQLGDLEANLDVAIHALGIDLVSTGTLSLDQGLRGTVSLHATPVETLAAAARAGIAIPPKLAALGSRLPPKLDLAITADGQLDGELSVTLAPTQLALANGKVALSGTAVLDHKKLRTANARVTLASLDLASLAALAGRPPKAHGSLSGTIEVFRDGAAKRADYDVSVALAKPAVTVGARGTVNPTGAQARATIARGATTLATVDATLPLGKRAGKLGLRPTGDWKLAAELARRPTAELAALLPPHLADKLLAKLPHGAVEAHIALAGTPAQPTGTIAIAATDGGKQVELRTALAPNASGLALMTQASVALASDSLAKMDATIQLPAPFAGGTLDLQALRAGATVDATIDLPARTFGSLAALRPTLARLDQKLGGKVAGHITAKGPLAAPALDATLRWFGYRTAAGTDGQTEVALSGTPTALVAMISHNDGFALAATIDRSNKQRIAIQASAKAAGAPLRPLLPAFLAAKLGSHELGRLDSNLAGSFAIVTSATGFSLEDVDVTGSLDVTGAALSIPNSERRYHDIGLTLAADPRGLRITSAAHETDGEKADRTLTANGLVAFANKKPSTVDLSLVAHDWLLFGSPKLGPADAPRASADFDIAVAVDLTKPVMAIDATVKSLALHAPERFERGHYQEPMTDDIIYLAPGMTAGKLPVTVKPAAVAQAPKPRRPMDVRIHIPQPIRVQFTPFDVMAQGEMTVAVRADGAKTRGALTVQSGTVYLFGKYYALDAGSLSFTDEHPHGWMDMTFAHPLPDAVMRELSSASGGASTRISFAGELTKPKAALGGAANSGLDDVMAINSAGRGVIVTRPDLPAAETVQAPRGDQLGVMTFLASNLPHLMFLDRISAWSDPADSAYGQIKHVEAERYTATNKTRIKAVVRPATPGRSTSEVQVDRMLMNTDRAAVGVGVRAGDRAGGGVGVFVEWSSKD